MKAQSENDQISLRNGYWFYFDDNGLKITAFGSCFSGKEIVFVDDEIVSHGYSWRKNSIHSFKHNMDDYEIAYIVTNIARGELACTLKKNGILLCTLTKAYVPSGASTFKFISAQFVIGLIAGSVFGFGLVYSFLHFRG